MIRLSAAIATIAITVLCASTPKAAEPQQILRPATSAVMVEAGTSSLTGTYLSPLTYHGWSGALTYQRLQAMAFDPQRWIQRATVTVALDRTKNPAGNALMWRLNSRSSWAMMNRRHLPHSITAAIGAAATANAGTLYSTRNGNNPVAPQVALTLDFAAMASWTAKVANVPIVIAYQTSVPLTGIFFSPAYGELFYEISLGNTKGLIHPVWPGTYLSSNHLLTADLRIGATALRLGASANLMSSATNDITTRIASVAAVVGISGEWLTLSPRRTVLSPQARIISALY